MIGVPMINLYIQQGLVKDQTFFFGTLPLLKKMDANDVVWHAGLTLQNTSNIQCVQKCAFGIILGKNYQTYEKAPKTLGLSDRRNILCKTFPIKTFKN